MNKVELLKKLIDINLDREVYIRLINGNIITDYPIKDVTFSRNIFIEIEE